MKKLIIIMLASGLLAAGACEKEALSRAGFSSPLTPGGSGQAALSVSHKAKDIQLKGTITLSEGQVELELLDPDQTRRYFQTIQAAANLQIQESYQAIPGEWTLGYRSEGGIGTIDLHIQY